MNDFDAFFQQLDSEDLLKKHGPHLVADAREILGGTPEARVAGLITTADSPDAPGVRAMLENATGRPVHGAPLVGIVPRQFVETHLTRVPDHLWREDPWQPQAILPVVVSTRDGNRFGFFPIHPTARGPE